METKKRNVGIEILRIISMFLIATSHICTQGGILDSVEPFTANYVVVWIIMCIAYCATNCYALISGYVGIESKFSYYRLGVLWIRVVFYTVLITIIFSFVKPESVSFMDYVKALTPATSGWYWYFSAYFALFCFMPFLNFVIDNLSRRQLNVLVVTMLIVFSVLPTLRHTDSFVTGEGYSPLWLMILYVIGGWLKKTKLLFRYKKRTWICVGIGALFIGISSKLMLEYISWNVMGTIAGGGYFISYISPIILLEAIALCGIFTQVNVRCSKIIFKSAGLMFSVYIIHQHPLLKHEFLSESFSYYTEFSPIMLALSIFGTAIVILVVCALIDYIREKIFVVLNINQHCRDMFDKAERKISAKWREREKINEEK